MINFILRYPKIFDFLNRLLSGNYKVPGEVVDNEIILNINDNILDLACGVGIFANKFNDCNYIGIDIDFNYLNMAVKKHKRNFVQMGGRQLAVKK